MTENEIINTVRSRMSERRFRHTEGCAAMADELARRWGEDVSLVRRAAYLHDIAKEIPYEDQLKMIDEFGVILTRTQRSEKIIHAFSGALIAWKEFSEPEEVCAAIRWHTTARRGMSRLEKIIWLADLTEEGRSFPGCDDIRQLAFRDLSSALVLGFDITLRFLINKGNEIDSNMIEARNYEIASRA